MVSHVVGIYMYVYYLCICLAIILNINSYGCVCVTVSCRCYSDFRAFLYRPMCVPIILIAAAAAAAAAGPVGCPITDQWSGGINTAAWMHVYSSSGSFAFWIRQPSTHMTHS